VIGGSEHLQRHLSAFTLLMAFVQLYLLIVRVFPNTPIPVYINMFTTVLKTYILILASYMAFLLSFAYAFFLVFGPNRPQVEVTTEAPTTADPNATTVVNATTAIPPTTTEQAPLGDPSFRTIPLSMVRTLVMFIGELDYTDIEFDHWLAYVILVLFLFLIIIGEQKGGKPEALMVLFQC